MRKIIEFAFLAMAVSLQSCNDSRVRIFQRNNLFIEKYNVAKRNDTLCITSIPYKHNSYPLKLVLKDGNYCMADDNTCIVLSNKNYVDTIVSPKTFDPEQIRIKTEKKAQNRYITSIYRLMGNQLFIRMYYDRDYHIRLIQSGRESAMFSDNKISQKKREKFASCKKNVYKPSLPYMYYTIKEKPSEIKINCYKEGELVEEYTFLYKSGAFFYTDSFGIGKVKVMSTNEYDYSICKINGKTITVNVYGNESIIYDNNNHTYMMLLYDKSYHIKKILYYYGLTNFTQYL